jgi:hypothetical protein
MARRTHNEAQILPEEGLRWLALEVDFDTDEAIRWLVQATGQDRWLRRADELLSLASGAERQLRSILERHHIEVCIAAAYRRMAFGNLEELAMQPFADAFGFALIAKAIHRHLSRQGKQRHVGKLKQALKEDYGFAALRTEHTAMMMGFGIGCKVVPADLEGLATYDLLLSDQGEEVELECKLLTHDLGHPFRQSEFNRLCRALDRLAEKSLLRPGSSRIAWLTLRDTLPRQDQELRLLATTIAASVVAEQVHAVPDYVEELRVEDWPRGVTEPKLAHAEARFLSVFQQCYTYAQDGDRSAFILAIISPPDVKKYGDLVQRKFKDAADQLSHTRPGVIFAELEGPNFDTGLTIKLLPPYFKNILEDVFRTRPYLELVIIGLPGPPFSSGASFAISNPRRKKRNRSFISRKLERNSLSKRFSDIPFKDFRKDWRREKYDWKHKSSGDVIEALRRFRAAAKKK